ncbi:uncharacterized protein LOC106177203 [Lingula anatina]|uniref:Uncharacterized protein LOC106177203 n=1 Tax=Lingula anatina TaxID=7574 RepID=A0A1S3JYA1_LINAN|nr:uncharacterized protein LOC106177203 [Lingula anatina]|eukprot:XP_013415363.1 uncharacterized protein LOC106177203 [Lingula anatina]
MMAAPSKRREVECCESSEAVPLSSPKTLLTLTTKIVAKNYTCKELLADGLVLDEILLKNIAKEAFPCDEKVFELYAKLATDENTVAKDRGIGELEFPDLTDNTWSGAQRILSKKETFIREAIQVGFLYTAVVISVDSMQVPEVSFPFLPVRTESCVKRSRVSINFEKQTVVSVNCSACRLVWCRHVIAAILFRIRFPEKVQCHAPLTETLLNLNREQLQKVIQYTVQSDPASTLFKVFQHMDEMYESTSEINQTCGAPDPTFVPQLEGDILTLQTLEKLKRNVISKLKVSAGLWKYRLLPESMAARYDPECLLLSDLKEHIHQVEDLLKTGATLLATKLLILLTEAVFEVAEDPSVTENKLLVHLCYKMEELFSVAVMLPNNEQKHDLVIAAKEFRRRGKNAPILKIRRMDWNQVPGLDIPVALAQEEPSLLFTDTLQAATLNWDVKGLQDVLDGKASYRDTVYEEPIPVVMLRIKTLFLIGSTDQAERLSQMGIQMLLEISNKYSIIPTDSQQNFIQPQNTDVKRVTRSMMKNAASGKRTKARLTVTKNNRKSYKQGSMLSSSLGPMQIVPCLLNLCEGIKELALEHETEQSSWFLICHAFLRVLDLARYMTRIISSFSYGRSIHMQKLDNFLLWNCPVMAEIAAKATDSILSCDMRCWTPVCPLYLVQFLVEVAKENPQNYLTDVEERRLKVVQLCQQVLCYDNLLEKQGSRDEESILDMIAHAFRDGLRVHQKREQEWLKEVLQQCSSYTNIRALHTVLEALGDAEHRGSLLQADLVMDYLMAAKIYLKMAGEKKNTILNSSFIIGNIYDLVFRMGIPSLSIFVEGWQKYTSSNFIIRLLLAVYSEVVILQYVPQEAFQLLLDALKHKGEVIKDFVKLLKGWLFTPAQTKRLMDAIMKNAEYIHPGAMFQLLREQQSTMGEDRTGKPKNSTFKLAVAVLRSVGAHPMIYEMVDPNLTDMDWLISVCLAGKVEDLDKRNYYGQFIAAVEKNCSALPQVLLKLLSHLLKFPRLIKHCDSLSDALIPGCKAYLEKHLRSSGKSQSSYEEVVEKMKQMRDACGEFVTNGGQQFDGEVIPFVLSVFRNKKKLCQMISMQFYGESL